MLSRRRLLAWIGLAPAPIAAEGSLSAAAPAHREAAAIAATHRGPELTPGILRALILRDLRGVTCADLRRADALALASGIPAGTWVPFSPYAEESA